MFETWITRELGIKYPIIQGAMHWLSMAELASAVSNAGGLGIIVAASFPSADELRQEIRKTRTLTDKPFAVNFTLMPTKRPILWEEYINAAIEEGIGVIETSGRNPEQYIEWLKASGVKVMHKVARVKDAIRAEKLGVDAVTIVGFEAGGHPGMEDVGSLVRTPKAASSLKIPVIAGGGFADGRGLVAALALGAEGVVLGTRFMASRECPMHSGVKEFLRKTQEGETVLIERSIKNAARVINTSYSRKVLDMEAKGATLEELLPVLDGNLVKQLYASGDTDASLVYCGQSVGLIDDVPTVKEIIDNIMSEAGEVMQRLQGMMKK